ncbi:unnamed protein product [Somion occarium]|uniref:Copper-fist domain-containing protein n=1 Tax=Somion occarium TaxID=3059160 RepID=A0ABP1CNS5_9APHY
MVFVNEKKFACESCIKGHRSSSCAHTDRPLFEVKKKGRPVSQCPQCRELRKTKKVHSRCECSTKSIEKPQVRQLTANSKRFIPILPALPNGLKDAMSGSSTPNVSNPGAQVSTLLNPCNCKDIWNCQCRSSDEASSSIIPSNGGLAALARAAALCCNEELNATPKTAIVDGSSTSEEPIPSCCQAASKPIINISKRKRRGSPSPIPPPSSKHRGSLFPPIALPPITSHAASMSSTYSPVPNFPSIPPLSSIAALAGSGCCCGFRCTCPGCVEHRGPEHASKDHEDCPDGCATCVDYEGGIELPAVHSHHSTSASSSGSHDSLESRTGLGTTGVGIGSSGTNFVDSFFARAAASVPLPPAPPQRARNGTLNPGDTTVYPSMLFASGSKHLEERGPAFGLVRLPKLKCCSGRCGCPDGSCGCAKSCEGCADDVEHLHDHGKPSSPSSSAVDKEVRDNAGVASCCSSPRSTIQTS